MVEGAE
ncbi:unnamed protein product, partial [Rotaria sp. Silwood1]